LDEIFGGKDYNFKEQRFLEMMGSFKALKILEIHIRLLLEREKEMIVSLITLL
jgi:hypothetical protein